MYSNGSFLLPGEEPNNLPHFTDMYHNMIYIYIYIKKRVVDVPDIWSALSRKSSTRTVCITAASRKPVHSRFGRKISETTQGSISTKCA